MSERMIAAVERCAKEGMQVIHEDDRLRLFVAQTSDDCVRGSVTFGVRIERPIVGGYRFPLSMLGNGRMIADDLARAMLGTEHLVAEHIRLALDCVADVPGARERLDAFLHSWRERPTPDEADMQRAINRRASRRSRRRPGGKLLKVAK